MRRSTTGKSYASKQQSAVQDERDRVKAEFAEKRQSRPRQELAEEKRGGHTRRTRQDEERRR